MLRSGATASAQRKGGPRSRSHNDDRYKGTLTGVTIPEGRRGSDGIEDFENLLENNYEQNRPPHNLRNTAARTTNTSSKNAALTSSKPNDDLTDRLMPRSRPNSSVGPSTSRALQAADVDYTSVPSPRVNSSRLAYAPAPLSSTYQNRSPAYDRAGAIDFSAHRPSQTLGAISRYQDEEQDAETVMAQYVDFDGGVQPDQDSLSPPPQQHSSPPQATRRLVHSPVVNRSPLKQTAPASVDEDDDQPAPAANGSRQNKGKPRATEEVEPVPSTTSIKVNGKRHANLTDDEVEQGVSVLSRKSRSARVSNDSVIGATSSKGKAIRYPEPNEDVQPDTQFDEPQFGDDAGDDFGQDFGDDDPAAHDEPPVSGTEQSGGESEPVQKKGSKNQAKGKEVAKKTKSTETEKKRRRKEDDDPPRPTKKPRSNSAKPTSQGRARTPIEPDHSYLEELVSPSEDEDDEEEGFVRRSRRAKIAPVKFWLGEKLEYETWQAGSNRQVPTILGVRRIPEAPAASLSRKRKKGKQKSRSKSRRLETEEPLRPQSIVQVETGWDDETVPSGIVLDFDTNEEVEKMITFTAGMVVPKLTDKGHFFYQRIFTSERYVAAGHIVIPPKGEKPRKSAKDNTYMFYLIEGAIQVIVHETKFYLAPGGMFLVPRGNTYYIRNMQDYDAKLFFVQARLMSAEDLEFYSRAGTAIENETPGKSRLMYSDEIGMSGGHRRSPSKGGGMESSSPQKRTNGNRPVASTSTARRR